MKFIEWLRPGIKIKRWFLIGFLGVLTISFGASYLIGNTYKATFYIFISLALIFCGLIFIYYALRYGLGTLVSAIDGSSFNVSLDKDKLKNLLVEKRILIKGPKIVVIGGGTGLSTMLRGLKVYSSNITAIVTVADNGGSSGRLRKDLGILPPGDIRHCILALADTEPILQKLLEYRFEEGELKGHSFGNLFLAAMNEISDNFEDAVKKMSNVLAVTGKVLPVTLDDITLCAELEDGQIIKGEPVVESATITFKQSIKRVFLEPSEAKALGDTCTEIDEADIIVLGPGSLYTSVIPNLLVNGLVDSISKSNALKLYVCNIMTQPGETDGFKVSDHLKAIFKHTNGKIVDYCIVNNEHITQDTKDHYKEEGAEEVLIDYDEVEKFGVKLIEDNLIKLKNNWVRHNENKLAQLIVELVNDKVLSKDKKRVIDYFYIKERLKKMTR